METKNNLKKGAKIGLIIMTVLILASFVITVMGFMRPSTTAPLVKNAQIAANLLTMVLTAVYAFWGYKKPHGNSLRISFLLFAAFTAARLVIPRSPIGNETLRYIAEGTLALSAILISYMGGRLHKIKKNKILIAVVAVLLFASSLIVVTSFPEFNFMRCVSNMTQVICWIALSISYLARFEEHRAAGLADKQDA